MQHLTFLLKFIFLGFIQGFTEPIPISSSGHLIILKDMLGIETTGLSFEIIVHFGSLLAIIFVYKKDILDLIKESIHFILKRDQTYYPSFLFSLYLLISTAITGIIGLTVEHFISEQLTKPLYVGFAFIITSGFIWLIRNMHGNKSDKDITMKDAIIIGLAQATSLIPGISRSGATVVAAMLLGLKRVTALRFSFLLFIPVSIGINILSLQDLMSDPNINTLLIPYTLALITSLIATYYALRWFIRIMMTGRLKLFSYYCFTLGIIVIAYQLLK